MTEASTDDWVLTISKDGVARRSTGETFVLRYPTNPEGQPDSESDYYFAEDGSLPKGYDSIMYDIWGVEKDELWEYICLENGHSWNYFYTRDGKPPRNMWEDLGYTE